MTNKNVDFWGPPASSPQRGEEVAPKVVDNTQVPVEQGNITPMGPSSRTSARRRNWGLLDVFFAFVAFIFIQIIYSVAVIAYAVFEQFSSGIDFNETELVSQSVLDRTLELATSGPGIFLSSILMYASWVFFMYRASFAHGLRSFAKDFGLRFNWRKDIWIGALLAVGLTGGALVISFIAQVLGVNMEYVGNTETITNLSGFWLIISAFVVASVLAPFFEEIFFRGFFMGAALRNFGSGSDGHPKTAVGRVFQSSVNPLWKTYVALRRHLARHSGLYAVILSSVIFGAMHIQGTTYVGQWLVVPLVTGSLGAVLAIVALKTKRLGINIFGHIFYNLINVILALFVGVS